MIRDLRAACVTGIMALASSLSTSALIFGGPLAPFLGPGLVAALMGGALAALVTASASGFRIAIAAPASTIAATLAAALAALDQPMAQLPPERIAATTFVILAITTLATGAALVVLGIFRLGGIVRFLPYPVIAGFMGITGWLLASGSIRLTTELPVTLGSLGPLAAPGKALGLGAGILFAGLLFVARRRIRNPATTPLMLIAAVLATNLIFVAVPAPARGLRTELMFAIGPHAAMVRPFSSAVALRVDWAMVATAVPSLLAIVFIAVLTTLLTCSGLEADLDVDINLDHELRVQGIANIVAAIGGGYVSLMSIGTTTAARASGAVGRTVGVATGLVCFAAVFGGLALIAYVPRFVVGGLQLQLGAELLWTWCILSRTRMPSAEWLLVVGIVIVAIWLGFTPAVLCGIIGGCVVFSWSVSRIDVVRRTYGLDERASSVVRPEGEIAVLAEHGGAARVIELSGFIFFGSAYQLLRAADLAVGARSRLLIIDFTNVTGGDSSLMSTIGRLAKLARRESVVLIFAALPPRLARQIRDVRLMDDMVRFTPSRDEALELAEGRILSELCHAASPVASLEAWLARALESAEHARRLLPHLEKSDLPVGSYVCRQGEPTDSLLFIESGRVGVMIDAGGQERRVRVFGPQTIAGEQGFLLNMPRSASLKVEEDATIWSLSRRSFEHLNGSNAELVVALMRDIIRSQAERLSFATRQTAMLAR